MVKLNLHLGFQGGVMSIMRAPVGQVIAASLRRQAGGDGVVSSAPAHPSYSRLVAPAKLKACGAGFIARPFCHKCSALRRGSTELEWHAFGPW